MKKGRPWAYIIESESGRFDAVFMMTMASGYAPKTRPDSELIWNIWEGRVKTTPHMPREHTTLIDRIHETKRAGKTSVTEFTQNLVEELINECAFVVLYEKITPRTEMNKPAQEDYMYAASKGKRMLVYTPSGLKELIAV